MGNTPIKEYVSDQHLGVKKIVKSRLPNAAYSYDVWHAAKNVAKRLCVLATKAKNRALAPWVRHVKNHFWWCAKTAGGNHEIFRKRWLMVMNHTVNIHVNSSGTNWCHHEDLPEDELREAPWLEPGSPAHKALYEVVGSLRTLDLAPYVVNFRHIGNLEVFHSANLVYTPKRTYFTPPMFVARKQVAMLDYSAHVDRVHVTDEHSNVKMVRVFSRISNQYVARPVKAAKTYPHVKPLLEAIITKRLNTTIKGAVQMRDEDPRLIHPFVHRGPRPDESREKLAMSRAEHSRFGSE